MAIRLDRINIRRNLYDDRVGLTGEITFTGDLGTVELKLSEEQVSKITELCAQQIIDSVKQVSLQMSKEVIGSNLIEHKDKSQSILQEVQSVEERK